MKRINKLLLIALMCNATNANAQNTQMLLGDVDGDGKLSISDVTTLIAYLQDNQVQLSKYGAADASQDYRITIDDVTRIAEMILNNEKILIDVCEYEGHEYVDLGLSVKWATCNIGAIFPTDYGEYYAWGEKESKRNYSWSTYDLCKGTYNSLTRYCSDKDYGVVDNKTILDATDDVAHKCWGEDWRIPTDDELQELLDNCTKQWVSNYHGTGIAGYLLTSKIQGYTGNSVFFPATGYVDATKVTSAGKSGIYWSSTVSTYYSGRAFGLSISSGRTIVGTCYRYYGFAVRAVF